MKIKKRNIIIGITIITLLAIILFLTLEKDSANKIPTLDVNEIDYQDLEIQEPDYSISDDSINKTLLTQTWTSKYEIAGISSEPYETTEYQIIFNQDNTFTSTTFGLPKEGTYEIIENQIILTDEYGETQTYAQVSETELTILNSQFPKKIVYEKTS